MSTPGGIIARVVHHQMTISYEDACAAELDIKATVAYVNGPMIRRLNYAITFDADKLLAKVVGEIDDLCVRMFSTANKAEFERIFKSLGDATRDNVSEAIALLRLAM